MSSKKKHHHHPPKGFSRRSFLEAGLFSSAGVLGMSPLQMTAVTMLQNILQPALAQENGVSRNYILLMIDQGLFKSLFDLPLRPNGDDQYVHNPVALTRTGNLTDPNNFGRYDHVKIGDYYLPYLWSSTVPHVNGGQRPIAELAQNAMMIRGIHTSTASHVASKRIQNRPNQGRGSLDGLNADNSKRPLPAVNSSWNYLSEKGIAPVSGANLTTILNAFTGLGNPASFGTNQDFKDMADSMVQIIRETKRNQSLKSRAMFDDSQNAKKLFQTTFGNLSEIYNTLEDKYTNLIKRSLREHMLTGFDKEAITVNNGLHFRYEQDTNALIGTDLRDKIVFNGVTQGAEGLTVTNNPDTNINGIASGFAIAEFLISNKLSSSVTINGYHSITGMYQRLSVGNGGSRTNANSVHFLDAHYVGAMATMFFHGKYHKAIAACMLELFDRLKAAGEFENTLFNHCTDFHRCGVKDGSGSDHGHNGSVLSLFGGLINGLHVGGNILVNSTGSGGGRSYPGTWGQGAGVDLVGGRQLNVGNAASSVATILGVQTPKVNDQSVVRMVNGKAELLTGKPKNV